MKAFLALAAATALVLAASGCTTTGQPATAPPPAESFDSNSDGGLGLKLLTEEDLPAGYFEAQLPTLKGGLGTMVGCPALDARAAEPTGEASVFFTSGTAGSFIHETIRVGSAADARKALADLAAIPGKCGNAKAASVSALGSESTAVEVTATPPELGVALNGLIISVRDEQTVVTIVYVNPGMANGMWRLRVADQANIDTGTLNTWSLTF